MSDQGTTSIKKRMESFPRWVLILLAFILGFGLSTFLVFQVLFLSKVLPHGGL